MAEIKWIEHQEKRILNVDIKNCEEESVVQKIAEMEHILLDSGEKNLVILLVEGSSESTAVKDSAVKCGRAAKDNLKKMAVVGSKGLQNIILRIVNTLTDIDIKSFKSEDEAKDWLAKE